MERRGSTEVDTWTSSDLERDYSLVGADSYRAVELGLAEAEWFRPPIDPERLAQLQQRNNRRPARDLAIWVGLLVGFAALTIWLWPAPWSFAALVVYGALYGGSADARWHEMGHNTAFSSRRINDLVYRVASFMLWREATVWRWSHDRHHTDTLVVGRDLEIAFQRPTSRLKLIKTFSGVGAFTFWRRILLHAAGRRDPEVADFMPEDEWPAVHREARQYVAIQVTVVVVSLLIWNPLPVLLIGLPTVYGMWLMVFFGITQHAGLQENVLDHRLNTRTVYMNPLFRFLYLNMNYHVEHHIFPAVPYYNLPALHNEVRSHLAVPLPNTVAAYRELLRALKQQRHDTEFELTRPVPEVPEAEYQRVAIADNRPVATFDDGVVRVPVDGLEVGRVRRVDIGADSYALYRLGPRTYTITDGFCTHGKAHLAEGALIDCSIIECPKHNGQFDITSGKPVRRPVTKPIAVYQTEIANDGFTILFRPNES